MAESCRCIDCGLLAHRKGIECLPIPKADTASPEIIHPICVAQVESIERELEESNNNDPLSKDRKCDDFWKRIPGFSPKENYEMMMHERLLNSQREASERQAERERQYRKEDVESSERKYAASERRHRWMFILTALAALMALVGSLIQAGVIQVTLFK